LKIRIINYRKIWTCRLNSSVGRFIVMRNYMAIIYTFHENVGAFLLFNRLVKKKI
jgi:hypothetical protein